METSQAVTQLHQLSVLPRQPRGSDCLKAGKETNYQVGLACYGLACHVPFRAGNGS